MKEKLTKNLGIKLLSLVIAAMMWIVIVNVDDPVKTIKISNIPVQVLNEDAIQSLNQVYEVVEGETVDLKIKGKRSDVAKLKVTDFIATADLSAHNDFYAVPIIVECPKYKNVIDWDITGKVTALKIVLEDIDTTQLKVNVVREGRVEEGYYIGSAQPKPNMIEISGAKSQIAKIAEVRVYLDVNNIYDDFKTRLAPRVFDSNGDEMDTTRMTFSSDEVSVSVKVLETKLVPITIQTKGEPAYSYQYIQKVFDPKEIEIAGNKDVLAKIDSIPITVNITGKSADVEEEVDLLTHLPDGIAIVDENQFVTIKVTIDKLLTREITFTSNDIKLNNLPEGKQFSFPKASSSITVSIMGLEENLDRLNAETLGANIDLAGLKTGKHTLPIQFGLGDKYQVITKPTIAIELTDVSDTNGAEGNGHSPSPSPSASQKPEEKPAKPTSTPNEIESETPKETESATPE